MAHDPVVAATVRPYPPGMRSDVERIQRNEEAFRRHNDILRLQQGAVSRMLLLCECGDPGCGEPLHMAPEEYEELRKAPRQFALVPGHDIEEVEWVVEDRGPYFIVQKTTETNGDGPSRD